MYYGGVALLCGNYHCVGRTVFQQVPFSFPILKASFTEIIAFDTVCASVMHFTLLKYTKMKGAQI